MFCTRKALSLYQTEKFHFVPGSLTVKPFGDASNSRKGIITASGAASVLSLGYMTREKYMRQLHACVDTKMAEENEFIKSAMDHGKKYEEQAATKFLSRFPNKWGLGDINNQYTFNAEFIHEESGEIVHVGATPDLQLVGDDHCLLEIKCPYRNWLTQVDISSKDEAHALMSDKHYIQVQTQLLVMALQRAFIFFYIPHRDGTESDNFCLWRVDEDPLFHQFLLSNFLQAYSEIDRNMESQFKTFRFEAAHNKATTRDSREGHLTFLIP
jgi:hypothetical protein